jgi:hypothetical protein
MIRAATATAARVRRISDGEAEQGHRRQRPARPRQDPCRDDGGERNGDSGERGGAPRTEQRQDHEEQQQAESQGQAEGAECGLQVGRRPVDLGVDGHAGHAGAHLLERLLDPAGDGERVGGRGLLHDEHEAGTAAGRGVADERLVVLDDLGHVTQPQPVARDSLDGNAGELLRGADRGVVLDGKALVAGLDEAAGSRRRGLDERQGRDPQGVPRGLDDLGQRHLLALQLGRVDPHLELAVTLPEDRDVRHAGDAHELGPDAPAGEHGQVDRAHRARGEADHRHAAGGGGRGQHDGRAADVRERVSLGQTFLDHLPGGLDVGAVVEDEVDGGQAGLGAGVDGGEPRHTVEQVLLEGHGDELLDLGGGQAQRLGLHVDGGRPELRVDIECGATQLDDAEDQRSDRGGDDEAGEAKAGECDPSGHVGDPLRMRRSRRCRLPIGQRGLR